MATKSERITQGSSASPEVHDEQLTDTPSALELAEQKEAQEAAVKALEKQIADLTRAAQVERDKTAAITRERDAATKREQDRVTQLNQLQKDAGQAKYDAIASAIAAAQAEAQAAERDAEAAAAAGDMRAQLEAIRRLSRAEANLTSLENGKSALEEALKQQKEEVVHVETRTDDPLEKTNLPATAKEWLRAHPDYLTDNRKNAKLQALHWDVVDEGHQPFSPDYFISIERHLGLREKPKKVEIESEDEIPEETRTSIVSAPVSREVPGGSGRAGEVKLNASQREAAKIAGISEKDYALQLKRLEREKANGRYVAGGN